MHFGERLERELLHPPVKAVANQPVREVVNAHSLRELHVASVGTQADLDHRRTRRREREVGDARAVHGDDHGRLREQARLLEERQALERDHRRSHAAIAEKSSAPLKKAAGSRRRSAPLPQRTLRVHFGAFGAAVPRRTTSTSKRSPIGGMGAASARTKSRKKASHSRGCSLHRKCGSKLSSSPVGVSRRPYGSRRKRYLPKRVLKRGTIERGVRERRRLKRSSLYHPGACTTARAHVQFRSAYTTRRAKSIKKW
mmetsp:Transcript_9592/g.30318  ORF Transcript_9592/g.30318 Transcript_9592/m.30318 type:complete len:255 (-) Transcript_9592:205-969(-)